MSFFARFPIVERDASPLFRILTETDTVRRCPRPSVRSFHPKFDVKETKEDYVLEGELPGIDQDNIEITFTDLHTIKVAGHAERNTATAKATPPASVADEQDETASVSQGSTASHRNPTVEDEDTELTDAGVVVENPNEKTREQPEQSEQTEQTKTQTEQESSTEKAKYWVAERSTGKFQRSFTFSLRVDRDNVQASLANGILSIIVPKLAEQGTRRIAIN